MNLKTIILEELNLMLENQMFKVYTQQNNDDFINWGENQPIYFSNDKNYWKHGKFYSYEAEITGNNIINLYDLQKELGRPYVPNGPTNYVIHRDFIDAIIGLKTGKRITNYMLEIIKLDAFKKGGEELRNNIVEKLKNADLIIGEESSFTSGITTYVVLNSNNVKILNKTSNRKQ
jgi:hypothetical protein